MSKDMHPSNWQTEAEQAYELLAEKDAEIERLKDSEADAEQRLQDLVDQIENITGWHDEHYPSCVVGGVRHLKQRKVELDNLFAIQQTRMDKATKLWQESTGETETLPDLGDLLDWLMGRADEIERKLKEIKPLAYNALSVMAERAVEAERELENMILNGENWKARCLDAEGDLRVAMDALRWILEFNVNNKVSTKNRMGIIYHTEKALADIEGETRAGFKVTPSEPKDYGDYPPDYGEEQIHGEPDFTYIKALVDNPREPPLLLWDFLAELSKAILWLRDQISVV